LFDIAEKESIRLYNKENTDKTKAKTINQAWGGFGKGLDKTIELVLDRLWELKKVGVAFIIVAHTRKKDVDDVLTGEQYSILTSDITQRYFSAIKTKLHFLGMAYIDRQIIKEKTGKKNIKTGEDIIKGKIVGESRVISFRDDTYSVDSKSRFAEIVDKIPFDCDSLINAIQDAIYKEHSKSGKSVEETKKKQDKEAKQSEKISAEYSNSKKNNKVDDEENSKLIGIIQSKYSNSSDEIKAKIKDIMSKYNFTTFKDENIPTKALEEIVNLLGE